MEAEDPRTRKRERQARRLMRVCLKELWTECLEAYVEAFEEGELVHGSMRMCAVGTMGSARGMDYFAMLSCRRHGRAVNYVEDVFEGRGLFLNWPMMRRRTCEAYPREDYPRWDDLPAADRRRLIYEACLEELARRRAEVRDPAEDAREPADAPRTAEAVPSG